MIDKDDAKEMSRMAIVMCFEGEMLCSRHYIEKKISRYQKRKNRFN